MYCVVIETYLQWKLMMIHLKVNLCSK